jgi:hypothetical protein
VPNHDPGGGLFKKLSPKSICQFRNLDSMFVGLRATEPTGVQLRVVPVQRLGVRA